MQAVLFKMLVAGGFASLALIAALVLRRQLDGLDAFVRRTPKWQRAFLGLFLGVFIAFGGTKNGATNNGEATSSSLATNLTSASIFDGPRSLFLTSDEDVTSPLPCLTVTPSDVARGWRLWEVRTNAAVNYAMPEGATLATNWWVHGAYEDVRREGLGKLWAFPLGSNEYDSVWAYTWGKIRPRLRDASNEIAAVGASMAAVPRLSRFWTAPTTNSYLLTWEDFTLGRVGKEDVVSLQAAGTPLPLVSAQIELFATGDFITRSNEVERVCRRVDPEDWDGDGWHNDDDWCPYDWDDSWDDFWQELPEGANTNAYCWIDIRTEYNSWVCFTGDGPSDLPDPSFMALAGRTYRVMLLIGKSYGIASSHPLTVVGRSDPSVEVDGSGTGDLTVVWPVDIYALEGNGNGFMMRVSPANLDGAFTWTQCCCPITGYGNRFWYAHTGYCICWGCFALGNYTYEGYSLDCEGGYCDCPHCCDPHGTHEDDGPYAGGATVAFSKSVVIFEDAYTNMPGEVVGRRSTRTILHCVAHGGDMGGTASFALTGDDRLVSVSGGSLPVVQFVPPRQKLEFDIEYEGRSPSGSEGDIVATSTFADSGSGGEGVPSTAELTSVKVELEAVDLAPGNQNVNRHVFGVHEWVKCPHRPATTTVDFGIQGESNDLFNTNSTRFFCPWSGGTYWLTATVSDVKFETSMDVIEPEVVCRSVTWVDIGIVEQAGLLDMRLALYVEPTYVSFKDLYMVEVPDNIECPRSGYFSSGDISKTGALSHTVAAGAGRWGAVRSDTSWMADKASRETAYPQPWSVGWKEWRIPIGWGDYLGNVRGTISPNPTTELFTIDSNGTATIRKFGHEIKRTVDNRVWLDETLQNE